MDDGYRKWISIAEDKTILFILDGDTSLGEMDIPSTGEKIVLSMPYLSGPDLCEISSKFGLPVTYSWSGGSQSRWAYLDDLINHCIKTHKESELLKFLFSKGQFSKKLSGYTPDIIEIAHRRIVEEAIRHINGQLYFGGNELVCLNNSYYIRRIGEDITVAIPSVKRIDRTYIKDLSDRAMKDVEESNYDSAITKCRTLLEEVFCFVIEQKGESPTDSGDINKLYSQVKSLYHMHQDSALDKRIYGLLSGLEKILTAISDMRNKSSDSHGVGAMRIAISDHHARLFVNSALTVADFILAVGEKQQDQNQVLENSYLSDGAFETKE